MENADDRLSVWERFDRDGYAIVRGFFAANELELIGRAVDHVHAEGAAHGASFRHGNLLYRLVDGDVRMVQWPSYHNEALAAVRTDARFLDLLAPRLGCDIKQIINQLHWKRPGGKGDFAYHQDSRFRRPAEAYRNLGLSYVQTGLAIDPHDAPSGGLRVLPGSHRSGELPLSIDGAVIDNVAADAALVAAGLDPAGLVDIDLAPGDLALWSPYLVHGSGTNRSNHFRRFYINGYVRAVDCDRGEWAFRDGRPVPLGSEQALVHYDDLHGRPEPHYV